MTYFCVQLKFDVMVANKKILFDEELQQTAALFKALAHPARLAILRYLAETKTCITGDIAEELPLSRTTVNQHLKELKEMHLIKGTIEGVKTNYCLNSENISKLNDRLSAYLESLDIEVNCS